MKKALVVLLVLFTLLLLGALGLRSYVMHKVRARLSPEQLAQIEEMKTKVLPIDPRELEPKPFDPATFEAARKLQEEWKASEKDARQLLTDYDAHINRRPGAPQPASDPKQLLAEVSRFENLTSAYARLVSQPDYELDVLPLANEGDPAQGMPVPNFLMTQSCAKLLRMQSLGAADAGRTQQALDIADTMIGGARVPRYTMLIGHLIAISQLNIGTRTCFTVIDKCNDAAVLSSTLQRLNSFKLQAALLPPEIPVTALDALGMIRNRLRAGIRSSPVGMTAEKLVAEAYRVEAEYVETVALPKEKDPDKSETMRKQVQSYRMASAAAGGSPQGMRGWAAWLSRPVVGPVLQSIALPNFIEAKVRSDAARAQFELLRTTIAMKLYRLETGSDVKSVQDLVPKYLPAVPEDVFSSDKKPYSLMPEPHSAGPDRNDQQAEIEYDPTNGTLSAGDIVLRPVGR